MTNLQSLTLLPAAQQQLISTRFLEDMLDEFPDSASRTIHAPASPRAKPMYGNEKSLKDAPLACFTKLQVSYTNHAYDLQANSFDLPLASQKDSRFTGRNIDITSTDPTMSIPSIEQLKLLIDAKDDLDLWGAKMRDFFSHGTPTRDTSPSASQLEVRGGFNGVSWFTTEKS